MVVREAGADGHIDFESSGRREEVQLRRFERIILMQLQKAMVISSFVRRMEAVKAKVEL